jgi:hypothetical protein
MAGGLFSVEVFNSKKGKTAKVYIKVMVYCCQNFDVGWC